MKNKKITVTKNTCLNDIERAERIIAKQKALIERREEILAIYDKLELEKDIIREEKIKSSEQRKISTQAQVKSFVTNVFRTEQIGEFTSKEVAKKLREAYPTITFSSDLIARSLKNLKTEKILSCDVYVLGARPIYTFVQKDSNKSEETFKNILENSPKTAAINIGF